MMELISKGDPVPKIDLIRSTADNDPIVDCNREDGSMEYSTSTSSKIVSEVMSTFTNEIRNLKCNDLQQICKIAMLARHDTVNRDHIVKIILQESEGLLLLYVFDAIMKNVGGTYISIISEKIVGIFKVIFKNVDIETQTKMYKLRDTWTGVLSAHTLIKLDEEMQTVDVNWPKQDKGLINFMNRRDEHLSGFIDITKPDLTTGSVENSSMSEEMSCESMETENGQNCNTSGSRHSVTDGDLVKGSTTKDSLTGIAMFKENKPPRQSKRARKPTRKAAEAAPMKSNRNTNNRLNVKNVNTKLVFTGLTLLKHDKSQVFTNSQSQAVANKGIPKKNALKESLATSQTITIVTPQSSVNDNDCKDKTMQLSQPQTHLSQRICQAVANKGIPKKNALKESLATSQTITIVTPQSSVNDNDCKDKTMQLSQPQTHLSQRICQAVANKGIPKKNALKESLATSQTITIVTPQSSVNDNDCKDKTMQLSQPQTHLSQRICQAVANKGIPKKNALKKSVASSQTAKNSAMKKSATSSQRTTIVTPQSSVNREKSIEYSQQSSTKANLKRKAAEEATKVCTHSEISTLLPSHPSMTEGRGQTTVGVHEADSAEDKECDRDKSNTDSLLNYSDDSPPVIIKPDRRKRTYKTWILVDEYDTYEEAIKDVKAEGIWSTASSNSLFILFRCNKVKKDSEQCQSGLRMALHEEDVGVSIYVSTSPHNCDELEHAKAKLDSGTRHFIASLFAKGMKCKGIEDEFIAARRPLPARYVLRNEIARLRRNDTGTCTITVGELHNLLIQHDNIPDDDYKAFVLDHQIVDKDDINFNFVISSKKLLQQNLQSQVCNSDTTYKLIWQGYPVGVTGHTDKNKKFHPTSISVSTKEEEEDFKFLFGSIKKATKESLGQEWKPPILMSDAAKAIPNGFRNVFGDDFLELMCWYHAKTAMENNVQILLPKEIQEQVIRDIEKLQLAQNPRMFEKASSLFIEKYEKHTEFVSYFSQQWLQLHRNWYEGASDDLGIKAPSCNNGLEVFNRTIKDEKTLRVRLPLQQFFILLLTWIETWGKRYDAGTSIYYHEAYVDLPLETSSYQWVKLKKEVRKHRLLNFYMVPAGSHVDLKHWDDTLKYETFDEYSLNVFQGWTTTVTDDWINGKCNCPYFMKNYMCKHVVGIAMCLKLFTPRYEATQIPLGQKRKRGRPKKAKKALIKQ